MPHILTSECSPPGTVIEVSLHRTASDYSVDRFTVEGHYAAGSIIIDRDFEPYTADRPFGHRDVAAFTLRAAGLNTPRVADIMSAHYDDIEHMSRTVITGLGISTHYDAGLAGGIAKAFESGLFTLEEPAEDIKARYATPRLAREIKDFSTKAADLNIYLRSLANGTKPDRTMQNRWCQGWFRRFFGVESRAALMLQWQLEQRTLAMITAADRDA